jgi:dihydroflavonol-4-reductase
MILVTGGTGLLGSHLLLELVREHEEVVAIKRPGADLDEVRRVFSYWSGEAAGLFSLIDWVDIDLMNYAEVERAMIDADQVYHCAAMVSFQPRDARRMIEFNVASTANIVNACLETRVGRMLHVSSSSAIGHAPEGIPATESMIFSHSRTNTAYSVSKFKSEMEVWRGVEEGLKAVIVNPGIVFGPGFWERGGQAIIRMVDRGLRYGTPGITSYVGILDVISAMTRLMASGISGERYILCSEDLSYAEVAEMIAEALGSPRKMKLASPSTANLLARLDAVRGLFTGKRTLTMEHAREAFSESRFSSEKVREAIGIEFTPIREVIRQVAEFYRADHPA